MVVVASRFRWRYRMSDRSGRRELLGRGRCDEQGKFRIELSGEPESDEGRVILVATARGHGFAARELTDLDATLAEADPAPRRAARRGPARRPGGLANRRRRGPSRGRLSRPRAAGAWTPRSFAHEYCPRSPRNGPATGTAGSPCGASGRTYAHSSRSARPDSASSDCSTRSRRAPHGDAHARPCPRRRGPRDARQGWPAGRGDRSSRGRCPRRSASGCPGDDEVTTDQDGHYGSRPARRPRLCSRSTRRARGPTPT